MFDFLKNSTFWIAVGSIATFFMAVATFIMAITTYKTLRWNQKEKKEKENKEITEKILGPLMGDLQDIKRNAKPHSDFHNQDFRWKSLKNVEGHLSSKLREDLRNSFDEFYIFFEGEKEFFKEQKNINLQNFTNRYDEIFNQADKLKNEIEQYQKKNL